MENFRFTQLHRFFDILYAHLYVGVMVVGVLWWGTQVHQIAILGPIQHPPTNIFEPNQVFRTNV